MLFFRQRSIEGLLQLQKRDQNNKIFPLEHILQRYQGCTHRKVLRHMKKIASKVILLRPCIIMQDQHYLIIQCSYT